MHEMKYVMKDYISSLTLEEKTVLCEMITGRGFKELFKSNEQEFSKIQKGFRAKSLTEQHALSIAIANVEKPFIATQVNIRLDIWFREIQGNIEKLEGEGIAHDIALTTTMLDSVFSNHVDLYFKLMGESLGTDARTMLYGRMQNIKAERVRNAEADERIRAIEAENRHLLEQVEAAQQSAERIKAEYEQKIQETEQEKDTLKSLLAEAQEKAAEAQTAPAASENDDVDCLAPFDDTNASSLPSVCSEEIVSLCSVISDYKGQKWLIRHADLSSDGCYHIFCVNQYLPSFFENRNRLFYTDGPSEEGFYGIWIWSSIPSEKDPSMDYVISRYKTDIDPIEVINVSEVSSLDGLINLLKNGIEYQPHSRRVMFSFCVSRGQCMGVLCNAKELNTVNGRTAFPEDCIEVPVYEFAGSDVLHLDNGLSFYRKAFAGLPSRLYRLKSPNDIVRDIVLSSISWTLYKARGTTRAEYKAFKDFLDAIPVDDITHKIEAACRCSNADARKLLDEFLKAIEKYVDGGSLEDEIVLSALSANSALQERTKALIRADWEAENKLLLADAQGRLDSLDAQLQSTAERLTEAQEALEKTRAEEEHLASSIAEKERLAEHVEASVAERIQKARANAADFIANMAFVGGQPVQVELKEVHDATPIPPKPGDDPYHVLPAHEDPAALEAHHCWADALSTAEFELREAGVAEKYVSGLAAFLCAAYIEKQPILLVGPNALDIVQAFSAAITGHKHGVLCCEGSCSQQILSEIGADGETIVVITNLLAGGWMNRLPEILARKEIFYAAVHPYAEDIQVEPKSLYGYMLPLFTEFFVDKKATGEYWGGYFADDFKDHVPSKGAHKSVNLLSQFALSSLVRNRINSLVATMHDIYTAATADDELLFAVLPIAYALLKTDELAEAISDPQKGIANSSDLKRELQYVLGEV